MSGKANNSKVAWSTARNDLADFKSLFVLHVAEASKLGGQSQLGPDPETVKMLQFVSDECNDLTSFCGAAKKDLAALNTISSLLLFKLVGIS